MILSWMLYSVVIGALIGVAALLLDLAAQSARVPARHIWFSAILLGAIGPLAVLLLQLQPGAALSGATAIVPFATAIEDASRAAVIRAGPESVARLDILAFILWALASAILLGRLALDSHRMHKLKQSWQQTLVDGQLVRIAPECGPAVVGTTNMEIVVPEWTLSFDELLRKLILRHEDEHRNARDPLLLHIARVFVLLFPWHIALHWQLRRLRLAVEVDCDARVLRAYPDADRYAKLLMAIALLRSAPHETPVLAMTEDTSQLEQRILAMRRIFTRRRMMRAIAATAAAVLVIMAACNITEPTGPQPVEVDLRPRGPQDETPFFSYEVEKMAELVEEPWVPYPRLLKQTEQSGKVLVQFVVDASGKVDLATFKVVASSNPLFISEITKVLPDMRFRPAEIGGRKVAMYVQLPFEFSVKQ